MNTTVNSILFVSVCQLHFNNIGSSLIKNLKTHKNALALVLWNLQKNILFSFEFAWKSLTVEYNQVCTTNIKLSNSNISLYSLFLFSGGVQFSPNCCSSTCTLFTDSLHFIGTVAVPFSVRQRTVLCSFPFDLRISFSVLISAWHRRPVSLPGHWEFSWHSGWGVDAWRNHADGSQWPLLHAEQY